MADKASAVEETALFTYTLDVPLLLTGTADSASRFPCCHRTGEQGHAATCDALAREVAIRKMLVHAGFKVDAPGATTPRGGDSGTDADDRPWLADFLNYAPHIDPYDDEASLVDLLMPYARLIRLSVEGRDRRTMRRAEPDEEPPHDDLPSGPAPGNLDMVFADGQRARAGLPPALRTGRISCAGPNESNGPKSDRPPLFEALAGSNDALRTFLRPITGPDLSDEALDEIRSLTFVLAWGRSKETTDSHDVAADGDTRRTSELRELAGVATGAEGSDDPVNHPKHYTSHPSGIECIDVIEHMTSNVAAAMKYLWRAGLKPSAAFDEDLRKAIWYVERERTRVSG